MVYLYYCQACEDGKHENCEGVTPCYPKGSIGGRKCTCTCACNGDPMWNDSQRIHQELQDLVDQIILAEKISKDSGSKDLYQIG
jgi:hypothetical protein